MAVYSFATAVSGDYVLGETDPTPTSTVPFVYNLSTHTTAYPGWFSINGGAVNGGEVNGIASDGTATGFSFSSTGVQEAWAYHSDSGTFSSLPGLTSPKTDPYGTIALGIDPDGGGVIVGEAFTDAKNEGAVAWIPAG